MDDGAEDHIAGTGNFFAKNAKLSYRQRFSELNAPWPD